MPSQKSLKYSYLECPKAYLWFSYRINNNFISLIKNDLSTHNLWVVYSIEYIKLWFPISPVLNSNLDKI